MYIQTQEKTTKQFYKEKISHMNMSVLYRRRWASFLTPPLHSR